MDGDKANEIPRPIGFAGPNGTVIPFDDPRAPKFEPMYVLKCRPPQNPMPVATIGPAQPMESEATISTAGASRKGK
ncbi:hypothetical protein DQ04_10531000 [Trypanosoma grayi]|uniref:hypothetical protein n=1 Tax=Trypanosoma grayi TaxID=71804 RepID=UPI0004F4518F|nr:hypothetical protein DQ04_10531000 [Trypanosoma grayi]KEG07219.1 hypothetical protein DQ04_10531000 [Trypanosoma grayi]